MLGRAVRLLSLLILISLPLVSALHTAASPAATDSFNRTWARTDKPVADLAVNRTWMWGPEAFTGPVIENYAEAPGGQRTVQYFDKSRMEDSSYRASDPWDVTNGLLVVEMMTGDMQFGDNTFQSQAPAQVNVGGDADDPTGPTYATMAMVRNDPPLADGKVIDWIIDRNGMIGQAPSQVVNHGVTATTYAPQTDHRVASVFWTFMNSDGPVWENGQLDTDQLFLNPYYATGFPVTEAYWTHIKVAGTYKWVLLQCFERRCLTYTPGNASGWQVEAGNVGQHYYEWRYGQPVASTPNFQFSSTFGEPWDPGTLMSGPQGIALGGQDIYVADTFNNRVQKYNYTGEFLLQWGSPGNGNGQFNGPTGVAVDSAGNVYVTDRGNSRVQIFGSTGSWLKTVTAIDTGGAILHTIQSPEDIAIGGGFAWVVDSGRHQLLGFPTYPSSGTGVLSAVNLTTPTGVAFDSGGNLMWVTDTGPGFTDLKRFDLQGSLQATSTVPGTTYLNDVTVDSVGNLWVIDSASGQLYEWHTVGGWNLEFGATGTAPGQFNAPGSMVGGFGGELVIADTGNNRIQRVSYIGYPVDQWSDNRRGRYFFPSGIEFVGNDGIYVVDTGLSRIQVVNDQGEFLDDWGAGTTVPPGDPALLFPLDIAVDPNGYFFVADSANNRIVKYFGRNSFALAWGTPGGAAGQFNVPLSVATDASGNVYVVDSGNHRIQKFDGGGNYITEWGGHGNLLGTFDVPSGVAVHGDFVYVVDQGNNRIQQFDLDGKFTGVWWGEQGTDPAQFNVPADITVGPNGDVYVADSQNHRVQAFTADGQFLASWGSGPGNGANQFNVPIDIAFSPDGRTMYVTDRDNHRVQVLTVP